VPRKWMESTARVTVGRFEKPPYSSEAVYATHL
jgi:hypothetical protein